MNNLKRREIYVTILILAIIIFPPAKVSAQDDALLRLSPHEAYERVLENSRESWSSMRDLDQAEESYRWRHLSLLPDLQVNASLSSAQIDAASWKGSLKGELSLLLQAENILDLEVSAAEKDEAKTALRIVRSRLKSAIYRDYFRLLLLQQELALLERQIQSAADRLEAARYDYENGRISEYEYLSAQLSYQETSPQVQQKKNEYESAIEHFKLLIGAEDNQEVQLSADLNGAASFIESIDSLSAEARTALSESPRLAQLQAQLRSVELRLKRVPLQFLPDLSISVSETLVNDFSDRSLQDSYGGSYALSIYFTLNDFLPGSQYRRERHTALTNLEDTRSLIQTTKAEQRLTFQELSAKLEASKTDIEAARFRKELADRFYSITVSEYENGRRDLLELEEADLKRSEAQLALYSTIHRSLGYLIELEELCGVKLVEW